MLISATKTEKMQWEITNNVRPGYRCIRDTKHIRQEKARIRRGVLKLGEQERLISEIYKKCQYEPMKKIQAKQTIENKPVVLEPKTNKVLKPAKNKIVK